MNFARDVVEAADPQRLALVERPRARSSAPRVELRRVARFAGTVAHHFDELGLRRGDVVLTLVGNRPEWVLTMVACFRQGYVVLPCTEQLRPKDLRQRLEVAQPALVVCDERNEETLRAAGWSGDDRSLPVGRVARAQAPPPHAELDPEDPCLITFTSGTAGEPKAVVHAQRYLAGQRLQAEHWLDARPGELVWCTAASGWSKSARNVFIAPWLRGAAALLHDERFDPDERLAILDEEPVAVLCMAPTEYRIIAKRAEPRPTPTLRGLVAAGEALNPEVLRAWHEATGLWVRDGYGQTETGQITGMPIDREAVPGSMGRPLPGHRRLGRGRRARARPADGADLLPRLPRRRGAERPVAHRRPRHAGRRRLPLLRGPRRRRHHLRRLPDRPLRGRVGAGRAPRGGRGRRRLRPRRRARRGRARRRRPARRPRARPTRSRASCRTTSRPRPRPTSTRGSSTSPASCPRRRAARSAAPPCVSSPPSRAGSARRRRRRWRR